MIVNEAMLNEELDPHVLIKKLKAEIKVKKISFAKC